MNVGLILPFKMSTIEIRQSMDCRHANMVQHICEKVHGVIRNQLVQIDGESLDVGSVIAVAK